MSQYSGVKADQAALRHPRSTWMVKTLRSIAEIGRVCPRSNNIKSLGNYCRRPAKGTDKLGRRSGIGGLTMFVRQLYFLESCVSIVVDLAFLLF